jgi:ribonuclease R
LDKKKKKKGKLPHKLPNNYRLVLEYFRNHPRTALNYKQVSHGLDIVSPEVRTDIMKILQVMEKEDIIEEVSPGKYQYVPSFSIFEGVVDMTHRGGAYVAVEEFEDDVRISPSMTGPAFNGDTVTVELLHQKKGKKPDGKIIEVIKRARTQFVGTVQKMKNFAFVVPDNSKIHVDFFISKEYLNKAMDGDKVVVELLDWPTHVDNPFGQIIKVLGKAGEHNTEMHAIVAEFGFNTEFNEATIEEAEAFPENLSENEINKRKDFRKTLTITIDPADAKDFDDAISYREINPNNFEIGVHIADVSHYVRPGTMLDDEAFDRATSVYLVDRTIPMLPERLSNGLCSLKPNVDRPAFSIIFNLDAEGRILAYEITKTMIHSDRRFSYEEAQEVIEGKSDEYKKEIQNLNAIAHKLRAARFKAGAISFESDEYKFKLDPDGVPIEVIKKVRVDAHKMIEDFMLLANKTVAKHAFTEYKGKPMTYRVHEAPNIEKMAFFIQTAKKFGYDIKTESHLAISNSINSMVEASEGRAEANLLHPLAIRSMEKAKYTTKDTSHFGLAFDYYTHFTSPIRRYPDLMVHRALEAYQAKKNTVGVDEMEKQCSHSSKMEVKATQAERASVKYKQTEFLSKHIGEAFSGFITGVTDWGIFVEMDDNHCEGMLRISDMKGDFYEFNEKDMSVMGKRTGVKLSLGDKLNVRIKKTNMNKRTVDLSLA